MRAAIVAICAAALGAAFLSAAEAAAVYTPIHSFCLQANCTDGSDVWSVPVSDGAGNYYGSTAAGGDNNAGTIYRLSFDGTNWNYTRLYSFCADGKCSDGEAPQGALIIDTAGNLYGTTEFGGDKKDGVVFELMPHNGSWTYKRLYSFCSLSKCADGQTPLDITLAYQGSASGVPYDGTSPLFGATSGDRTKDFGSIFQLTSSRKKWTETIVYKFCALANCADGATPYSSPMIDGSGNLFGTTTGGGDFGQGAIYELVPQGKHYAQTVLYSFCAVAGCDDGTSPFATPVMDGKGNLYGTTSAGGAGAASPGQGTVYELAPNGVNSRFTKLYDFCNEANCTDGASPWAGVAIDGRGNIFGTTFLGGTANGGLIYELSGKKHTAFHAIVSFGTTNAPGTRPIAGLVANSKKTFLGMAADGSGGSDGGVFYELKP